jgi:hypothetical protein
MEMIYVLRHDGLMRGMSGLATALATFAALGLGRTSARQIRRRGLGRVLRILGKLRFEFNDLGAGCGQLGAGYGQLGARGRKLAL